MNTIKFCTRFNERKNKRYFDTAQVVDKVPSVGDGLWFGGCREVVDSIYPAWLDAEQPSNEVYDYRIYEIEVHDADDENETAWRYIAVMNV